MIEGGTTCLTATISYGEGEIMGHEELRRVALDAEQGTFAPHLGLTTDTARIEFLARELLNLLDELQGGNAARRVG